MTLLKVDRGVDTGPIYGHFTYEFDELHQTHIEIQSRSVFDNLDALRDALLEIAAGTRQRVEVPGRGSKVWGQPWLSEYYRWKRRARAGILNGEMAGALLYHDVDHATTASGFPGQDADLYKITVDRFRDHLQALLKSTPIVSCPADLSSPRPDGTVILSFDDGGVSAHTTIAPILEQLGIRGAFFIVTEKIGMPGFMTRGQILDLHQRGHVIGSHSHTHPMRFASLGEDRILQEWRRSREILEEVTGAQVLTASVPGGFYSSAVARLAEQAGYQILYNSEPCAQACYVGKILVIGRFIVQRQTSAREVVDLAFGLGFARWKQGIFWNVKKVPKAIGGPLWIAFRKRVLNRSSSSPRATHLG
jgi:peptidoglycan/xylan/chitin deacetylase (PgdA/CDA1 family)